jgi:hypothetical protein
MLIEFTKRWRSHAAGSEMSMPDGAANLLIRRGIAVSKAVGDPGRQTATLPPARPASRAALERERQEAKKRPGNKTARR